MDAASSHRRFLPSSFDLTEDFHFIEIAQGAPWPNLSACVEEVRPQAVFGLFPEKFQLDVRVYETIRSQGIPYMACNPRNSALAAELIRQLHADLVVATREEALALEQALIALRRPSPTWFIILRKDEVGLPLPLSGMVITETHASPGIPL